LGADTSDLFLKNVRPWGHDRDRHRDPCARIAARGKSISGPCFVASPTRLMLPAFGAYTGGLDVRDPAIGSLYRRGARLFLLGEDRLFSFSLAEARASEGA
jgi:metallophosphoesterase superfamily enzyme